MSDAFQTVSMIDQRVDFSVGTPSQGSHAEASCPAELPKRSRVLAI